MCLGIVIGDNMRTELYIQTYQQATENYDLRGAVSHSDRGSQYTSEAFRQTLASLGIISTDDIKRLFTRQDALIQLSKELYGKFMQIQDKCTNFELSHENLESPERYHFYRQLLLEYLTDLEQLQCELNTVSAEIHKYLDVE